MVNRGINPPPSPTQILDIICDYKLAAWDLTQNSGAEAGRTPYTKLLNQGQLWFKPSSTGKSYWLESTWNKEAGIEGLNWHLYEALEIIYQLVLSLIVLESLFGKDLGGGIWEC